jgi:hypothetical protein
MYILWQISVEEDVYSLADFGGRRCIFSGRFRWKKMYILWQISVEEDVYSLADFGGRRCIFSGRFRWKKMYILPQPNLIISTIYQHTNSYLRSTNIRTHIYDLPTYELISTIYQHTNSYLRSTNTETRKRIYTHLERDTIKDLPRSRYTQIISRAGLGFHIIAHTDNQTQHQTQICTFH